MGKTATCQNCAVVDSLKGRLLVATPDLRDPNFHRTVVLMLEHNDEGALGLVLNRPSDTPLAEVLPDWKAIATEPGIVFVGGPVQQTTAICLARRPPDGSADAPPWDPVLRELGIGTVDLDGDVGDVAHTCEDLRVFAGYSGWGEGQLEGELEVGGWYVLDALAQDAFSRDPSRLWRDVLARQGGALRFVASYPPDPSMN